MVAASILKELPPVQGIRTNAHLHGRLDQFTALEGERKINQVLLLDVYQDFRQLGKEQILFYGKAGKQDPDAFDCLRKRKGSRMKRRSGNGLLSILRQLGGGEASGPVAGRVAVGF